MTVLWTDDVKARADAKADAKESRTESRTDAETESTEFASEIEAESSAEWVTSLWLDVKPAADKNDAKFLGSNSLRQRELAKGLAKGSMFVA